MHRGGKRNWKMGRIGLLLLIGLIVLALPAAAQLSDPFTVWGYVKNETGGNASAGLSVTLSLTNVSTPCLLNNQTTASGGSYSYDLSWCGSGYYRNDAVELNITNATQGSFGYTWVMIPPSGPNVQAPNMTLKREPQWRDLGQNKTSVPQGDSILLYARGVDGGNLTNAWLATNETGVWQNWSMGKYGSPINFSAPNNSRWLWSNFSWQNGSITPGTNVGWRIYYQDNEGRTNNTGVMVFNVTAGGPVTRVVNQSYACTAGYAYYYNIQSAIDAANPGDEIVVCGGTYTESITVNKSITLRAYNTTYDAIVNSTSSSQDAIAVSANYVNISWLKVQNATGADRAGINVSTAGYANISHVWATSNYDGIRFHSFSNNNTLTNNNINDNSDGIVFFSYSSNNTLTNNNVVHHTNSGIYFYITSSNNTLTNNTASGNTWGIFLGSSYNNITNNNVSGNAIGIYLYPSTDPASSYNNIVNNTANNNTNSGIYLGSNNNYNNIINNTANSNANRGIYLNNSSNNTLTGNNIFSNTKNGVTITGNSLNNPLNYNNIYNNPWNLNLTQSQPVNATYNYWGTIDCMQINNSIYDYQDNVAYGNVSYQPFLNGSYPGGQPMTCGEAGPVTRVVYQTTACTAGASYHGSIYSAITAANPGDTIKVCAGTYYESPIVNKSITLMGNNATYDAIVDTAPSTNAITVTSSNVNISWLKVTGATGCCTWAGITVRYASYVNISNVWVTSNDDGIFLANSNNVNITNSNTSGNSDFGIRLYKTNNSVLTGITANNNTYGIVIDVSSYNTVQNSIVNGNSQWGLPVINASLNNTLLGNNLSSNYVGIYIYNMSDYTKVTESNIISNTFEGIRLYGSGSAGVSINNNNIYNNPNRNLNVSQGPNWNVNATYNWWGTTDCAQINMSIYDYQDNPSFSGNATFQPFLNADYPGGMPMYCVPPSPPSITAWNNSKTNNASLSITLNTNEPVQFYVQANQTGNFTWFNETWSIAQQNFSVFNATATASWPTLGTKYVRVNMTNMNGSSQMIEWNVTVIDTTPPLVTINLPLNGGYNAPLAVNATVTDAESSIMGVTYRWENATWNGTWLQMSFVGGNSWQSTAYPDGNVSDGNYTIRINATNSAGLFNSSVNTSGYGIGIDMAPPVVNITLPANNWYNSPFTINVSVTDASSGVNPGAVYYRWENATFTSTWKPIAPMGGNYWEVSSDLSPVSDGNYTLRIMANDTLNNSNMSVNTSGYNIGVDRVFPNSSITSPANGSWQRVNFSADITDTDALSGPASCTYRVLSNGIQTLPWSARSCSGSVTLSVGSGMNCDMQGVDMCRIESNVTDKAGNAEYNASRVFSIDWTAPVINNSTANATPMQALQGENVTLSVNITDNINVTSAIFTLRYPNGTLQNNYSALLVNGMWNFTFDTTGQPTGMYNWTFVNASDAAGNFDNDSIVRAFGVGIARNISVVSGRNLIALPVDVNKPYYVEPFCKDAPSLNMISRVLRPQQNWLSHICGIEASNYSMELGEGYWASATSNMNITIMGFEIAQVTQPLSAGWNLIGVRNVTQAEPICNSINATCAGGCANSVVMLNTTTDQYSSHVCGFGANNFTMAIGAGYWVNLNQSTDWTY